MNVEVLDAKDTEEKGEEMIEEGYEEEIDTEIPEREKRTGEL